MWQTGESKVAGEAKVATESRVDAQKSGAPFPAAAKSGLGVAMEQATVGATTIIKGEISGEQALFVDGRVEGSIHFPNHRVTIGRGAVVLAEIHAREVVIVGTVTGNVHCGERMEIRADAVLNGDVVAQRISVDEGAVVKGNVEVQKSQQRARPVIVQPKLEVAPKMPAVVQSSKAAAAGVSVGSAQVSRVSGSSVMYEEKKGGR